MTQRNYAQSTQLEPGSGSGPPPVFDLAFVSGTQTVSGVTTTDTTFDGNPDIQFTRTIGADVLADGSNDWYAQVNLIQEVGNAAARFRLQRVNSSGVVQSSSAYSAEQVNAGIATLTTTWDSGTWVAGDRLVCSVEFRQNGGHIAAGFNIGRPQTFVDAPDQLPVSGIGIGEASNATSASTDRSITPPASELLVADIMATSGAAIPTPTMSGWGGTWVLERATGSDTDIRRAFRFRCVIASPTAGTPTVDFGATSVGNISIRVRAVHDAENTNNGADAFLHGSSGSSTLHRNVTTAATRTFLKLQDFADAQNIGLFNAIGGQTEPMTVEGAWVKDFEYHGGIASQVTAFLVGGANEAAISWTTTGHHLMIASEIAVAGSADPASPERASRLAQGLTNAGSGLWQTASVSPAADRLLVFFVQGPNSDVPTPSGWGLTWSQVSPNVGYDTAASPSRRLTAFVAKTGGSAPGADTADVQFAGTPTVVNGSLFEVEGHDLSASALGNIVQAVAEAANAVTSISDTMAAFGDAKNGTLIAAISDNATWNYPEVGDGFELLDQDGQGDEPKVGWRYSNDTSPSFDTLQSADVGFLALEIKAAVSGAALLKVENEEAQLSEDDLNIRGLIHVQSESIQLADTDLRFLDLIRQVQEVVQLVEQSLRVLVLVRIRNEPIQVLETSIPVSELFRLQDELSNVSETDLHIRGLFRVQDEDIQALETDLNVRGIFRIQNEAIDTSETTQQLLGLVRLTPETMNLPETDLRFQALLRTESETTELSEQDISILGLLRLVSESENLIESDIAIVTPFGVAIVKVQDESIQVSELDSHLFGLVHVEGETTQVSESTQRLQALTRLIAESSTTEEVILRFRSITREQAESANLPEGLVRTLDLLRRHSESISTPESPSYIRGLPARIINETTQLAESTLSFVAVAISGVLRVWRDFRKHDRDYSKRERDYNARDRDYD